MSAAPPPIAGIRYRRALDQDQAAIDRLFICLDDVHADARPDLFYVVADNPRGVGFLHAILNDPEQFIVVAEDAGAVVGFAHAMIKHTCASPTVWERHYVEIDAVVVDPAVRSAGIGRRLIEVALDWGRDRGMLDQQINVHAFNEDAKRLYERIGFKTSTTTLRRVLAPTNSECPLSTHSCH